MVMHDPFCPIRGKRVFQLRAARVRHAARENREEYFLPLFVIKLRSTL